MLALASLAATALTVFSPQGDQNPGDAAPAAQAKPALLDAAAQESLRKKLQDLFATQADYDAADGVKDREKTGKARDKAKEKFQDEWNTRLKKGNLLGSMPDLREIFFNCFEIKAPKNQPGTARKEQFDFGGDLKFDYSYLLPKGYKPAVPMPCIVMLPGGQKDAGAPWTESREYLSACWGKTEQENSYIFHVADVPENLTMDPVPDYSREGQEAFERRRIACVWGPLGKTMKTANLDRRKLFLDCGRGNCAFGVRLASMFPDRFAGIVLRSPTAIEDIRLGSLFAMPVLAIQTAENKDLVETLKKQFEAVAPGLFTVIEAKDTYPFKASAGDIDAWMGKQSRNIAPAHVVIEPNHDQYNKAYWVKIDKANLLTTSTGDQKPRIEVTADRANNRIVVKAQGIEAFTLLLNDELVDLDKEFTVVVNDKATTELKTRDMREMQKRLLDRLDWEFLFPVAFSTSVAK